MTDDDADMDIRAADAIKRLRRRLAEVEGEADASLRLANEATALMNRAIAERDTARQQLAKPRAALTWAEGAAGFEKPIVIRDYVLDVLTLTGADAVQVGGRDDG